MTFDQQYLDWSIGFVMPASEVVSEQTTVLDRDASVAKFADQVKSALIRRFPYSRIMVEVSDYVVEAHTWAAPPDRPLEPHYEATDQIDDLAAEVFNFMNWVVLKKGVENVD